jgi:cytoskeletal protein RodZ
MKTGLMRAIAAGAAGAALALSGCGGDDDKQAASQPSTTEEPAASETAPAPEPASETISIEEAKAAIEAEGIKTNETDPAGSFIEPVPEATFSLVSPDTGTVAHGGVAAFKTAADAEKAAANSDAESVGDLENLVVANLLIQQEPEPYEGFPTAEEIAAIVQR